MATPFRTHPVLGMIAATEDVFARFDDDAYVLSDDDGIGALFDGIGHNRGYDTSAIGWADLRRWAKSAYWDMFYDVENLVDYWEDDRIDRLLISYNEWLMWESEYH